MRRSSRLILLLGAFLALGAFLLFLFSRPAGPGGGATPTPSTVSVVVAATDIPQGTQITADMVSSTTVPVVSAPTGAFTSQQQVVGQVVQRTVTAGSPITQDDFGGLVINVAKELKAGERAMAVQVDQVSGVGTLIQPGDHVDGIITLAAGDVPVVVPGPQPPGNEVVKEAPYFVVPATDLNSTSVKLVVQNVRVVATLLPPPTTTAQASPAPEGETPALTGRQQIVILAVTAQQAEVLRYAQSLSAHDAVTGAAMPITLLLRSPVDATAPPDVTTGVILRTLIDQYGVLPPDFVSGSFPPR